MLKITHQGAARGEICYLARVCVGEGRSSVYGTVAADGVFDGVIELTGDHGGYGGSSYSVERADRYLGPGTPFPSVIYRHRDIATGVVRTSRWTVGATVMFIQV